MKTAANPVRLILAAAALGLFASLASAGPQNWQTLSHAEQFKQLKPGDKIVYVCNQCKTLSEVTVGSADQAMEHCKEGAAITCPSCKTKVKVVVKGPPKNRTLEREVTYTNEKGEECLFVAKVPDSK